MKMDQEITNQIFYYAPGACSLASHIALEEAGAKFSAAPLVFASQQQRHPRYLAINPQGRVPALVVGNAVITESIAVLTYIAQRYPEAQLLPFGDPRLLARAYELMSWFASSVHISFGQIWRGERFTDDISTKEQLKADGRQRVLSAFQDMDRAISHGEWFLGDRYSVVDPYALVFWRWGPRLEIDMAAYPVWSAHANRVLGRPATQRALAREQSVQVTSSVAAT